MYSSYLSLTSPLITAPFPPPSPLYFFYLSLFLIFIRLSPVCLTRASFHFISFDDNLSFPIRLPRSPPLYPPGRSPSFSSPPPGSRLRRQCVVRHLTERQQKKRKNEMSGKNPGSAAERRQGRMRRRKRRRRRRRGEEEVCVLRI